MRSRIEPTNIAMWETEACLLSPNPQETRAAHITPPNDSCGANAAKEGPWAEKFQKRTAQHNPTLSVA